MIDAECRIIDTGLMPVIELPPSGFQHLAYCRLSLVVSHLSSELYLLSFSFNSDFVSPELVEGRTPTSTFTLPQTSEFCHLTSVI